MKTKRKISLKTKILMLVFGIILFIMPIGAVIDSIIILHSNNPHIDWLYGGISFTIGLAIILIAGEMLEDEKQ